MRTYLHLLFVVVLLITPLAGCGGEPAVTETPAPTGEAAPAEGEEPVLEEEGP